MQSLELLRQQLGQKITWWVERYKWNRSRSLLPEMQKSLQIVVWNVILLSFVLQQLKDNFDGYHLLGSSPKSPLDWTGFKQKYLCAVIKFIGVYVVYTIHNLIIWSESDFCHEHTRFYPIQYEIKMHTLWGVFKYIAKYIQMQNSWKRYTNTIAQPRFLGRTNPILVSTWYQGELQTADWVQAWSLSLLLLIYSSLVSHK